MTTIAAPVGKSRRYEAHSPSRLAVAVTAQPTANRPSHRFASMTPLTAGTIKYANVRSTPASRTKLTTTSAKAA